MKVLVINTWRQFRINAYICVIYFQFFASLSKHLDNVNQKEYLMLIKFNDKITYEKTPCTGKHMQL